MFSPKENSKTEKIIYIKSKHLLYRVTLRTFSVNVETSEEKVVKHLYLKEKKV